MMLPHLPITVTRAASTAVSFTPRAAAHHGRSRSRGRRSKHKLKPVAFPPPPLRRLVSSSLRRLLPRPRHLTFLGGGGWFGVGGRRRRATPAEELAALALSLALGDKLAVLADYWNSSGLGQALGVWAAVWRRGGGGRRRRRGGGLRRLAALLLGIAFCALVCHLRSAALVDGLARTTGGRKLARIFLH